MSLILFSLLFVIVISGYVPPRHASPTIPCPIFSNRSDALYTGQVCSERYSCCFSESIMDPISGNFSTMSCCYAYGTNGTYKCCGRNSDYSVLLLLLLLLPITPFIIGLIYICCCKGKDDPNPEQNLESIKVIKL